MNNTSYTNDLQIQVQNPFAELMNYKKATYVCYQFLASLPENNHKTIIMQIQSIPVLRISTLVNMSATFNFSVYFQLRILAG